MVARLLALATFALVSAHAALAIEHRCECRQRYTDDDGSSETLEFRFRCPAADSSSGLSCSGDTDDGPLYMRSEGICRNLWTGEETSDRREVFRATQDGGITCIVSID